MAIDGKILSRAKTQFENKKRQHARHMEHRLAKVYNASPRVRELDMELRASMSEYLGAALGIDTAIHADDIRIKNLKLQEERKKEIVNCGFQKDYLDNEYMCLKCHDTGYINIRMCDCLKVIYKEEQRASLSNLFKLGNETFDSFNLMYYDDISAYETSISPRRNMEIVYEMCVEYARKFGNMSMNLFLTGAPGLGKTFLSACIARVVADKGFSVVYDTAPSIFSKYEDAQFQRVDDIESIRNEIKRYLECDLLIIDDLGTEMTTAFTISALYEIINTRLITAKKTLVSSNYTTDDMQHRYSQQIMSRLEGEYQILKFYGDDIRKKKNVI